MGLESDAPGASHPLLGIMLFPSVLSLEPAGHGLSGGWGGSLLGTQTPDGHPVAGEQGEPSAGLDKRSKNKTGPPGMFPPSCWQLLIYAKQMYENPKSPVGPGGQGRVQLAEPAMKGSCVPLAAWSLTWAPSAPMILLNSCSAVLEGPSFLLGGEAGTLGKVRGMRALGCVGCLAGDRSGPQAFSPLLRPPQESQWL